MATHRNEVLAPKQFDFVPTSFEQAKEYAMVIANSGVCPESFKGRPNDIIIVMVAGRELGLSPMQSLRTLGVVNGMPFAWGDGLLSLVKRHPQYVDSKEWFEGELENATLTAFCTMYREGEEPKTQKFSIEDAKRAGLWLKKGTWSQYPKRMLQHRARTFAARDQFPDALFGLPSQDEAYAVAESQKPSSQPATSKGMAGVEEALGLKETDIVDASYEVVNESVMVDNVDRQMLIDELNALILSTNTSERSIQSWLAKAAVERVEDLQIETIQKGIDHFKTKGAK